MTELRRNTRSVFFSKRRIVHIVRSLPDGCRAGAAGGKGPRGEATGARSGNGRGCGAESEAHRGHDRRANAAGPRARRTGERGTARGAGQGRWAGAARAPTKTGPHMRPRRRTESRKRCERPYSPSAFFRAETRRRETGIFSSTAFSVSSSVPPDTDSISSTIDRFTR